MAPSQAEVIPARKKPRLEEPSSASTDEAARKTASPEISVGLPHPAADNVDVNVDPETDAQPHDRATSRWTTDEDAQLIGAVANTSKKKHKTDWVAISALVTSRTKSQCRHRWHNALDPSIDRTSGRTGKWTVVEDSNLKDGVQTHGDKDWVAISALVPGRTRSQCRHRWLDALDCSMDRASGRTGKWASVEDVKLKDAVQLHGGKDWVAIAALVPGRTRKQCRDGMEFTLDPSIL
jgi:hypothetical protein